MTMKETTGAMDIVAPVHKLAYYTSWTIRTKLEKKRIKKEKMHLKSFATVLPGRMPHMHSDFGMIQEIRSILTVTSWDS